ncbi:MAG TPA: helix-turn-helix transcriptional regulator [Nocardioidaceae bacterium]|nr:helix-turn-helix transcriptional regulator [Nocardioidaceae bacterium]
MDERAQFGEFLTSRRNRLTPEAADLPMHGRRRVPGLRREEVAQLAGLSVDYYVRLEQGRAAHPSESVLDAIARALQLDEVERAHLYQLARPKPKRRRPPKREQVRPGIRQLLDRLDGVPAFVLGRRMDVLAWNRLGASLHADFDGLPPRERNMARLIFLDPASIDHYPEWERVARDTVGILRGLAGRHSDDQQLAELIGELSMNSEHFRRWWAAGVVRQKTRGRKLIRHPVVGDLDLHYETLQLPDAPDQVLVTYTAAPGSESETSLALLASWAQSDPVAERLAAETAPTNG